MLRQYVPSFPEELRSDGQALYTIMGMWVNPMRRKQGLGRDLIRAALGWVRNVCEEDGIGNAATRTLAMLQIGEHNTTGRKLYERIGFAELRDDKGSVISSERDDMKDPWMKCVIE